MVKMKVLSDDGFKVYNDGTIRNASGMNNDVTNKRGTWRFYCDYDNCKFFIKVKWGGEYGCITAETGQQCDIRNQVWYCEKHAVVERLNGKRVKVENFIK